MYHTDFCRIHQNVSDLPKLYINRHEFKGHHFCLIWVDYGIMKFNLDSTVAQVFMKDISAF